MDLWSAPIVDVRPVLVEERADLLVLLEGLTLEDWDVATSVPCWTVRDIALHLLDDDLGWLSRGRDADLRSMLDMSNYETFVASLAAKNQRWVDGAQGLSARVITQLLRWTGEQMDAYYASIDLMTEGGVSWAGGSVPQWFDIAQDLTERWVHQQQMREALGRVGDYAEKYLSQVLRTFVWAMPHQYRVVATAGKTVVVDLASGGAWSLTSDGAGRWSMREVDDQPADARVRLTNDAGWRWFTGAAIPEGGWSATGDPSLTEALHGVRGIIVERT